MDRIPAQTILNFQFSESRDNNKKGAGTERRNESVETRAPKIYQSDEKDKNITHIITYILH